MIKTNKFAIIIIVLALIIALFGIFLWEDLSKANPDIINNRASQNTQAKPPGIAITVRKADNTTETVEINMPMIIAVKE